MFKLIGFDHVVLRTNQLDAMIKFYCEILGCNVEKENKKARIIHLRAGRHMIDLLEVDDAPAMHPVNMDHFCLRISPFNQDFLIKYFKQNKVKILDQGSRFGAFGIGPSIYLEDPQGNVVELKEEETRSC